jgi:hypothetical protein
MGKLKRTGGHGRKKSTGKNMSVNMGEEKGTTEKIGDINEAKENTTIKYNCIYAHPDGVRGYLSLAAWQPRGTSGNPINSYGYKAKASTNDKFKIGLPEKMINP